MMKKIVVFGLFVLAACGQQNGESAATEGSSNIAGDVVPTESDLTKAAELVPADAQLAAKYDRSCRACHSTPDATAPLTGHKPAWDKRFAVKDAEALLASTKTGLNAMPPMGLCNDCTDEELKKLTAFMAGRGS